jgi:hypothetical protein
MESFGKRIYTSDDAKYLIDAVHFGTALGLPLASPEEH